MISRAKIPGGLVMPGQVTAVFSAVCYALSYICLRRGQADTHAPDNGLFPVLMIGAIVLGGGWVIHAGFHGGSVYTEIRHRAIWILILAGLIGPFLGRLTLYAAIERLGATRGVVVKSLAPLVTLVIAMWVLNESPEELDYLGFLLLGVGIFLVYSERLWWPHRLSNSRFVHGLCLGLIAAVLQGSGHALRKFGLLSGFNPVFAAAIESVSAACILTVVLAASGHLTGLVQYYRTYRTPYFATAGFLSAAGVLLFFVAVSSAPVTDVAAILASEPVLVACLSAVLMPRLERLTWASVAASVVVAAGIVLLNMDL